MLLAEQFENKAVKLHIPLYAENVGM